LRQPIVKGVLFLALYYAAAAVVTGLAAITSEHAAHFMLALLTPVQVFDPEIQGIAFPGFTYAGLLLQIGVIGVVLMAINNRLVRPMRSGAAA
jgi:hypothetical protein